MKEIVLEKVYDEKGKYLGKIRVFEEELTPEFLKMLKEDKGNVMKWKKYHKKLKEKGYDFG